MKTLYHAASALTLALTLAACGPRTDAPTAPANASSSTAGTDSMSGMTPDATAARKTAKGMGTVTAVNANAGTITVDHAPIPEAGWPAMTMAFKATPALAQSVKAGDKVAFDLNLANGGGEITAIQKQ